MKIVIVGGHMSPALALIEALPKDTEILYIGRKHALEGDKAESLEYQKISALNIPFVNLTTGRLQRKFTRHTLKSILKIPRGFYQALRTLQNFKPDAVVCFGGYVQIPVVFAAFFLRIPVIAHEQTRKAGLANKIIAPLAAKICISWEESARYFPKKKTVLTGLPIRKEFIKVKEIPACRQAGPLPPPYKGGVVKTILITGGSLGAHAINVLVEGILEKLLKKYYIIHQTGDAKEFNDYERLNKKKEKLPRELRDKYELFKFVEPEKVARIMVDSDLVISRAGMNTAAELIYLNKPCILIPLPHGQTNEQLENGLFVQSLGLGRVVSQNGLTPELLYSQVEELTAKLDRGEVPARESQKQITYDTAEKIIQIIKETQK